MLTSIVLNPININQSVLIQSLNETPKYKNVLSEDGIKQLKKMLFKNSSKTNSSCPIFYIDFEEDNDIIELPCKHIFTPNGIEKWLKEEKNECPVCRYKLKSKEIIVNKTDIQVTEDSILNNEIIPHSYIETIIAREEDNAMEQAILASIKDLENQHILSNMNLPID